jgi:hypothetical protein
MRPLLFILLSFPVVLSATVWPVGPTRVHTKPSQVSSLVADGDTVAIDAGVYTSDVCIWHANNLTLTGVGTGYAKLDAQGNAYGGKAIWVIGGNHNVVQHIEFTGCKVADQNGAGIRQEGVGLTVRYCYFHDNEEGILAGDKAGSEILIEYTVFEHNGFGDGYSHNLYINHVQQLTFRYNWTHRAIIGHELKSRAYTNLIYCNRISNEDGNASREIDLPNGGKAWVLGNIIQQGPNSQNSNIIEFGLEGLTNPGPQEFYLINNTIWNQKSNGSFLDVQSGTALVKMVNNLILGAGKLFNSALPTTLDSTSNLFLTDIAAAKLTDPANFDFQPLCTSPVIDAGTNPGLDGTMNLLPDHSYLHPNASVARTVLGAKPDIGAYEANCASLTQMPERPAIVKQAGSRVFLTDDAVNCTLDIYDMAGRLIASGVRIFDLSGWPPAVYVVALRVQGAVVWTGKIFR